MTIVIVMLVGIALACLAAKVATLPGQQPPVTGDLSDPEGL